MMTPPKLLSEEYRGRAKVDDNIIRTRAADEDTPEAERFWQENVARLDEDKCREVELPLPSISGR